MRTHTLTQTGALNIIKPKKINETVHGKQHNTIAYSSRASRFVVMQNDHPSNQPKKKKQKCVQCAIIRLHCVGGGVSGAAAGLIGFAVCFSYISSTVTAAGNTCSSTCRTTGPRRTDCACSPTRPGSDRRKSAEGGGVVFCGSTL